jgi:hypothetical protein
MIPFQPGSQAKHNQPVITSKPCCNASKCRQRDHLPSFLEVGSQKGAREKERETPAIVNRQILPLSKPHRSSGAGRISPYRRESREGKKENKEASSMSLEQQIWRIE